MDTTQGSNRDDCPPEKIAIASAAELAQRFDQLEFALLRKFYSVRRVQASTIHMNDEGWLKTKHVFGSTRSDVENQELIFIKNNVLGNEAIINPLRSKRFVISPCHAIDQPPEVGPQLLDCRWCRQRYQHNDFRWTEAWEMAQSSDLRVVAQPNWARQSQVSGLVFGDQNMHYLNNLLEAEFVSFFETAQRYIELALAYHPKAQYFMIFLNGGPKSAGSMEHAHLQVVGREDQHFSYPELITKQCPVDYWDSLYSIHDRLNLTVSGNDCTAWANLAPVKERDITVISETISGGAKFLYPIWRSLAGYGTQNFSLAAILSPAYFHHQCPERFVSWPNVVWRFVDRGDPGVKHSDMGTMELFGSSVVGDDPFVVSQWMRAQ